MKKHLFFLMIFFIFPIYSEIYKYDIVIYGANSAGIISAIQASRLNKSVVLIHPGSHIGGAIANGLSKSDCLRPKLIGGITKEFFQKISTYYSDLDNKCSIINKDFCLYNNTLWSHEPHVAENLFKEMLEEAHVPLILNEKLKLIDGVHKNEQIITQIEMLSGNFYEGKMFIDSTYEGDLMAGAKVSYIVGRESNDTYHETLNGIKLNYHSKLCIDPYIIPGNPASGCLPRISLDKKDPGSFDDCNQAYTFRLCLTDDPNNKVSIEKPENYEEWEYEILFRALKLRARNFIKLSAIPNRKKDCNNFGLISTDYIGKSKDWAEADYETREKMTLEHQKWQQGLLWTLQNHSNVPYRLRYFYQKWGLAKDEFVENNHWPYELYVREARRMISCKVMTEHTVLGKEKIEDAIAATFYHIDSHNVRYYVNENNTLSSEGGLFVKIPASFLISYQSIIPKQEECQNLFVPVCLSASHVGYAPIRMEPTYMILGQSAAIAASLALDLQVKVQDVPYEQLRSNLISNGQILEDIP